MAALLRPLPRLLFTGLAFLADAAPGVCLLVMLSGCDSQSAKTTTHSREQQSVSVEGELVAEVIRYVLTSPTLSDARESYGTKGERLLLLAADSRQAWPQLPSPVVGDWVIEFRLLQHIERWIDSENRHLGLQLEYIHTWRHGETDRTDVCVTLFNFGGTTNGAVIGGVTLVFSGVRRDGGWEIKLVKSDDA